jgi:hypothetical protein
MRYPFDRSCPCAWLGGIRSGLMIEGYVTNEWQAALVGRDAVSSFFRY